MGLASSAPYEGDVDEEASINFPIPFYCKFMKFYKETWLALGHMFKVYVYVVQGFKAHHPRFYEGDFVGFIK